MLSSNKSTTGGSLGALLGTSSPTNKISKNISSTGLPITSSILDTSLLLDSNVVTSILTSGNIPHSTSSGNMVASSRIFKAYQVSTMIRALAHCDSQLRHDETFKCC